MATSTAVMERPADRPGEVHSPGKVGTRITGIDVARAVAVLGMILVHTDSVNQVGDQVFMASRGRSSILFALLAGLSLALTSGGAHPHTGERLAADRRSIAVRGFVLLLLGMCLTALGTPVIVILSSYAVLFWVALPVLTWSWQRLTVVAAASAVVAPLLSLAIRKALPRPHTMGLTATFDMFTSWHGLVELPRVLLLDGQFPVLTWAPYVLAGLALGRWGVKRANAAKRLLILGTGMAVVGYGGSVLALNVFGGKSALVHHLSLSDPQHAATRVDGYLRAVAFGRFSVDPWQWILACSPHTGTPFEIVGSGGVALAVIGLCLLLTRWVPRVMEPLVILGRFPLTVYAGHIVVIALLIAWGVFTPSWVLVLSFLIVPIVFCWAWARWIGRGPLERVLTWIGNTAGRRTSSSDLRTAPARG